MVAGHSDCVGRGERLTSQTSRGILGIPTIVYLAHSRDNIVRQTIRALSASRRYSDHNLVVLVDGRWPETVDAITSQVAPVALIESVQGEGTLPRTRILRNVRLGLKIGFEELRSPYCVVVEDDILVSKDFLDFISSCMVRFGSNPKFRAVNGFSRMKAEEGASEGGLVVGNYGVGWGWALNFNSYRSVRKILNWQGDYHWDSLLEPFMRTGFVVNPTRSRIMNIGFGEGALHTDTANHRLIGEEISASFLRDDSWTSNPLNLRISPIGFRWRGDFILHSPSRRRVEILAQTSGHILLFLHTLRNSALRFKFPAIQRALSRTIKVVRSSVLPRIR